jgi:superfamily II DNA/RNA helicase
MYFNLTTVLSYIKLKNKKNGYIMTFDTLSLHPKILKAVTLAGYTEPTKIQLKAIPKILSGFDIRASAQTGTGKTAAFLLPALNRLTAPSSKPGKGPRVLILVPTRELAMQIAEQAEKYSKYLHQVKTVCVVGGVPYPAQLQKLSRPYDILIATPGRLIDFINRRKVDFSRLELLVLDEADRMLDMGFVEPVEQIVAATPSSRQTLMFSATLEGSVIKLSDKLLNKPMEIVVHAKREKHENITQQLHYVDDLHHKNRLLDHILSEGSVSNAIVFTSTKRQANQLVGELHDKGYQVGALHGDMNQSRRTRTITQLKNGKIRILVATDVAARGIDVQSITHIINYDLPRNVEDYVHRIGRTGRAGAQGTALSFAAGRDVLLVKKIKEFTGQDIDIVEIAGLEPRLKQAPPRSKQGPRSFRGGPKQRFKKDGAKAPKGRPFKRHNSRA